MKKKLSAAAFVVAMAISSSAMAYYELQGAWHHWWSGYQPSLLIANNTGRTLIFACNGSTTPTEFPSGQLRGCSPAHVYIANDGHGTAGITVHYCNAQWQCSP